MRYVLGDFNPDMPDDHVVCVDAVVDFTSAFLFSVETQHTIGLVLFLIKHEDCQLLLIDMEAE